jgi:hypothetical protein
MIELRLERRPILRLIVITALAATATTAVFLPLLFLCVNSVFDLLYAEPLILA